MAVEQARIHIVPKPWGGTDPRPWHAYHDGKAAIEKICLEHTDREVSAPALLLKLIFTNEPRSIRVHPDGALARAIGLSTPPAKAAP
ncbi:MAG: cupin domain-containing protein [Steroidobacteraceae bacterium]